MSRLKTLALVCASFEGRAVEHLQELQVQVAELERRLPVAVFDREGVL
jgi:hypothetical protein